MFKRLLIVLLLVGVVVAVEPFGTHLFADDYTFSVGDEVIVSANLVYFNGSGDECNLSDGNVTANINGGGSLTDCTNGDGFVSFDFGKLDAGNYSVEFSYSGNGNYSSCNESINVNVLPSTPPDNNNSSSSGSVDVGGGSVVDGVGVGLPVSGLDLNVLLFLFCVLIGCFIKI
ncbi:MAG: Ig-like domain-containing protein [Methanobrevibacter sp.]|jgi:hypothetical protein|nr:Ig-like domain-containing protein [Candidatus Methanovirga australis]